MRVIITSEENGNTTGQVRELIPNMVLKSCQVDTNGILTGNVNVLTTNTLGNTDNRVKIDTINTTTTNTNMFSLVEINGKYYIRTGTSPSFQYLGKNANGYITLVGTRSNALEIPFNNISKTMNVPVIVSTVGTGTDAVRVAKWNLNGSLTPNATETKMILINSGTCSNSIASHGKIVLMYCSNQQPIVLTNQVLSTSNQRAIFTPFSQITNETQDNAVITIFEINGNSENETRYLLGFETNANTNTSANNNGLVLSSDTDGYITVSNTLANAKLFTFKELDQVAITGVTNTTADGNTHITARWANRNDTNAIPLRAEWTPITLQQANMICSGNNCPDINDNEPHIHGRYVLTYCNGNDSYVMNQTSTGITLVPASSLVNTTLLNNATFELISDSMRQDAIFVMRTLETTPRYLANVGSNDVGFVPSLTSSNVKVFNFNNLVEGIGVVPVQNGSTITAKWPGSGVTGTQVVLHLLERSTSGNLVFTGRCTNTSEQEQLEECNRLREECNEARNRFVELGSYVLAHCYNNTSHVLAARGNNMYLMPYDMITETDTILYRFSQSIIETDDEPDGLVAILMSFQRGGTRYYIKESNEIEFTADISSAKQFTFAELTNGLSFYITETDAENTNLLNVAWEVEASDAEQLHFNIIEENTNGEIEVDVCPEEAEDQGESIDTGEPEV
jgi:hypothetical protein